MHEKRRAFTLVELVIVLVILAILVGIALPAFTGARAKAYRAEALPIMNEIKAMAWCYRLQYGNDTKSGWFTIPGAEDGTRDDRSLSPNVFRAIGYSSSDIPKTDNFDFYAHVRGDWFIGTKIGLPLPGGNWDCDGAEGGGCFIIEAMPRQGSKAQSAGALTVWLAMNISSNSIIGYTAGYAQ